MGKNFFLQVNITIAAIKALETIISIKRSPLAMGMTEELIFPTVGDIK